MQLSPTTHSEKPLFIFKLFYFFQVGFTIFWRILTWNYPPPKWDYGGSALDCNKGNKRNWILVWEGGFFEFYKCEQASSGCIKGRFGVDVFFKMSHEVYNYGEGLVRKVATSNTHKWVFRDPSNEGDSSFIFSWNVSLEPQPRAWEFQFKTGIQMPCYTSYCASRDSKANMELLSLTYANISGTEKVVPYMLKV